MINDTSINKLHLVKWTAIYKPKRQGGLGVSSISLRNSVLLFKWWWRSQHERDSLWNRFLRAKYGNMNILNFNLLNVSNDSSSAVKDIILAGSIC